MINKQPRCFVKFCLKKKGKYQAFPYWEMCIEFKGRNYLAYKILISVLFRVGIFCFNLASFFHNVSVFDGISPVFVEILCSK